MMLQLGRSFRPASFGPRPRHWPLPSSISSTSSLPRLFSQQRHAHASPAVCPPTANVRLTRRPQAITLSAVRAGGLAVGRRWETSARGDDDSGHIAAEPGEGILFLDNVFPLRIGNLLAWRPWRTASDYYSDADISRLLKRFAADPARTSPSAPPGWMTSASSLIDPVGLVRRAIPTDLDLTITEIVPRLKDGGVFVKFRHPSDMSLADIEARMAKALHAHPVRPWFNPLWGCMRAGLVRGIPWLEDLASRVPSSRVRVDFCAPPPAASGSGSGSGSNSAADVGNSGSGVELSQETLYSLFRRYGKIAEIHPQASDSKILPRYATVDFIRVRDAVMARSCLHGHVVNGATRLQMSYETRVRAHHIWDWLTSHPRIVIPILAALLATLTVAIFDPIRSFFIRAHVQRSFALRDSQAWKWLQLRTSALLAFARSSYDAAADNMGIASDHAHSAGSVRHDALMTHRHDLLETLRTWLLETAETFIVIQGPRGSGKNELVVDQALRGRRDVLVVDCKPIVEARGDTATIKRMAAAIGYRPVFSWANSISSLVDLAVQGTTGLKAGFSETLDEQLSKILQTATVALRDVALAGRRSSDVDAALNTDAYLEAHAERRPVIVLDNFGHRNEDTTGPVYDKLAQWAAALVQANIAHVIFLTSDTSYPKALVKAMPDRVFRQIALGDLSPDVAVNYVLSHLAVQDEEPTAAGAAEDDVDGTGGDEADQHTLQPVRSSGSPDPAVVSAVIDAQQRPKDASGRSSILDAIRSPFRTKTVSDSATAATATTATNATPSPTSSTAVSLRRIDPGHVNTAAAKAALSMDGGISAATAASSVLPPDQKQVIQELNGCIGLLGGRLTDLESLVRRLRSGQTPQRAVSEIVEQSASEIIKMFLLAQPKSGGAVGPAAPAASASVPTTRAWTAEQAWYLVREIAARDGSVAYNDVLLSDLFGPSSSGVAAIDALIAAELVTARSYRGRPQTIRAGSPVYLAAFKYLVSDAALAARMNRSVLADRAALEAKTVAKVEQELTLLASLPRQPAQASERTAYLLNKLQAAQRKIQAYETEIARLKKIMAESV